MRHIAKVSEELNRKCRAINTRWYNSLLSTAYTDQCTASQTDGQTDRRQYHANRRSSVLLRAIRSAV